MFSHLQRKVLKQNLNPEQLFIPIQTTAITQNTVGECVCVCVYVWVHIQGQWSFPYVSRSPLCYGGRGFSPTWLPLMSHINHSLCTIVYVRDFVLCVYDTRIRGGACERTLGGMFWNPWHRWLKPLITTQINSLNAFASPFVKERRSERVSEGQFADMLLEEDAQESLCLWPHVCERAQHL